MDIEITKEWDKVFPKSDNVDHEKVSFRKGKAVSVTFQKHKHG